MGIGSKFKSYFALEDEYEYKEETVDVRQEAPSPVPQPRKAKGQTAGAGGPQNVVSLQSVQKTSKVILFEPRAYSEAQEIADHLKSKRAVVINLQRITHDQAERIVDF